jgi:menaquinone-9 beta-reductase
MVRRSWDVVVAGGGPAGLAAAIAARRKGLDVAVYEGISTDKAIDKCCGEGLLPEALDALGKLGSSLPCARAVIGGIRFLDGETTAEARFLQQVCVGVRRTALHGALSEQARQTGVSVLRGAPVRGLAPGGVLAGDDVVRCRWIVGADGTQSVLRRAAGLELRGKYSRRFGSRRHFRVAPWSDLVEIYWAHGVQAYVTPVAEDEVGVAFICGDSTPRFHDLLPLFPTLAARLEGSTATSTVRGAMTASRRLAHVTRANVALIGDASGSVDAVTGFGLSLAFQQAVALGDALAKDDLSAYEAAHRRIERMPRLMEALMLLMARQDWFRRRTIRALAAEPAQFTRVLAVHSGALQPVSFALHFPMALGRRFFTA